MSSHSFDYVLPAYAPAAPVRKRLSAPGLAPDAYLAHMSYQVRIQGTYIASRYELARQRDTCRPGLLLWDYIQEICRCFGWCFKISPYIVEFRKGSP